MASEERNYEFNDRYGSQRSQEVYSAEVDGAQNDVIFNCENTIEEEESFEFEKRVLDQDKENEETGIDGPNSQTSKYLESGIGSLVMEKSLKVAEEGTKDFINSLPEIAQTKHDKDSLNTNDRKPQTI